MKKYFAYIRVSTARQGERGVSLQEQRDAIVRYAERNGLGISKWFEERETAAKRGRPVFGRMLKLLRLGRAGGVVIHKIDRSARNLKDWADLGELIDVGIEVHFANESLDLHSRGGRLSADIQAVVAADYIRNLREESRKGFYGRVKQGLFPLPAPIGYVDRGAGQPKEIDSAKGPLVRRAFDLYATGRYNLDELLLQVERLGLRNRRGGSVSRNGLSTVLNNPFYIGLIKLQKTGEVFPGAHEPIVPSSLFQRVQRILKGKVAARVLVHDFLFRRLLSCATCAHSLIGEGQKGHVYYRCHGKTCPRTCLREETVEKAVLEAFHPLQFDEAEKKYLGQRVLLFMQNEDKDREARDRTLRLRLERIQERLSRLTDAYLDEVLEKDMLEQKKAGLLVERRQVEEEMAARRSGPGRIAQSLAEYLELAGNTCLLYESASLEEKRDLLKIVTSNRRVSGKNVELTLAEPLRLIAERSKNTNGRVYRDRPRTLDQLLWGLRRWVEANPAARVPTLAGVSSDDTEGVKPRKGWKVAA